VKFSDSRHYKRRSFSGQCLSGVDAGVPSG
jgi:hypothetical protein